MALYRYQGVDPGGQLVSGTLDATSLTEASGKLRDMGIVQGHVELGDDQGRLRLRSGRVRLDDLIEFNNQLAAMARAGIPLDRALKELVRQMRKGQLREALETVADEVRDGVPLADAMARHGDLLPPTYVELVRAGLQAGNLPELLLLINQRLTLQEEFRRQMVDAFTYPAVVMGFALAIAVASSVFLRPIALKVYSQFNVTMTGPLAVFFRLADMVPLILAVVLGAIGLTALLLLAFGGTRRGRRVRQALLGLVPYYRRIRRINTAGQLCSALAMFLRIELTLPEALRMAARTTTSERLREGLLRATTEIESGTPLREALEKQRAVPRILVCSVNIGEARGDLPHVLEGIAEMYRRQGQRALALARVVLPLAGIAIAGLVVGSSAMAVLWPLIRLIQQFRSF
ncbi:MAG: type II secretion system F family protein [Planctomycetes bacterium]|nr:type II secretion system F family protein [Planctomycetota bacterium]